MMLTVELHDQVVKFLEDSGCATQEEQVKSYVVNNTLYTQTDVKGMYVVSFYNNELEMYER
ncbi:hypothetical protein [Clostridium sp.]|jgi:hypothetical protein|uniref:hypothetical protein n=1 Tax=Clostridium sp. TaxID=1506 RepID=UPI003EEB29BF